MWESPHQREAYTWFALELPNLRAAFRWAADHGDLDTASALAVYAPFVGYWMEQHEPIAWAEELIGAAEAAEHRRLIQLYMMAMLCAFTGHIDDFLRYAEASQAAAASGRFDVVRADFQTALAGGYITVGQPKRAVDYCRSMIAESGDPERHHPGMPGPRLRDGG